MRVLAFLLVVGSPPLASAEQKYTKDTWPEPIVERPLTLPAGMLELRGNTARINLSSDRIAEPISLAPDLYFGVTGELTAMIRHDVGICLTGEETGCPEVYDDFELGALYSIVEPTPATEIALLAAFDADSLSEGSFSAQAGGRFQWNSRSTQVELEGVVDVGLSDRDAGNGDEVRFEVEGFVQLGNFVPVVETGLRLPFDDTGDNLAVPLGFGAFFTVSRSLDVGARIHFPEILGGDAAAGGDARELRVHVHLRI